MNKLLLTLIIGIGLGILIAPAKGSDTVQKLRDKLDDFNDNLQDKSDDLMDREKDMVKKGKKLFDSALD